MGRLLVYNLPKPFKSNPFGMRFHYDRTVYKFNGSDNQDCIYKNVNRGLRCILRNAMVLLRSGSNINGYSVIPV